MKFIFSLLLCMMSITSFAQEMVEAPLVIVEQMPEFLGGQSEMMKFIQIIPRSSASRLG